MTGNKGLRQFLDPEQQRAWLEGEATPPDADERSESLEQRFKYAGRLEKLLQRPQAQDLLDILRLYAATCIPLNAIAHRTCPAAVTSNAASGPCGTIPSQPVSVP